MHINFDTAICRDDTGLDPFTGQEMHVARHLEDRLLQQALLQNLKSEIDLELRQALLALRRGDLIGSVCDA